MNYCPSRTVQLILASPDNKLLLLVYTVLIWSLNNSMHVRSLFTTRYSNFFIHSVSTPLKMRSLMRRFYISNYHHPFFVRKKIMPFEMRASLRSRWIWMPSLRSNVLGVFVSRRFWSDYVYVSHRIEKKT